MDYLSRIGIYTEVVKHQSFAGAARKLGITSSAVSKQIQNLEHALEVKLLNRTTRKVSVTEEGAIFFERANRALEDLKEAEEHINEMKACPRGPLKISLPHNFTNRFLLKPITAFAKQYPEVNLDVSMDDRHVDLIEEGFDVVVRIGALTDSTLIARKLAHCPVVATASPEYLEKHGIPESPEDLSEHDVIGYTRRTGPPQWQYKEQNGKRGRVSFQSNFKCDSGDMELEAVKAGIGIALLPIFYVTEDIKEGNLVPILSEFQTWPEINIYALFPPNRYLSTRVRLFVDHLTNICRDLPWVE